MHFDWTALGTWATFFATIAVGAFVYGKLTEKVATHDAKFIELSLRLNSHASDLKRDRDDIVRIKTHLNLD